MLDRRQCNMLAEMGVRAYLPQCCGNSMADVAGCQTGSDVVFAAKQTNVLPPPAQAAVVLATQKERSMPVVRAASQTKPATPVCIEPALAPQASQQAPYSLCLGLQCSKQGDGPSAAEQAVRWLFVCDVLPENASMHTEPAKEGVLLRNMAAAVGVQLEQTSHSPLPTQDAAWLLREIDRLEPQIIVALGRPAAAGLLGSSLASGRLRGQVHHLAVPAHDADLQAALAHIPVIFSYPLDYLLREPKNKANAWQDLCLARSVAEKMR